MIKIPFYKCIHLYLIICTNNGCHALSNKSIDDSLFSDMNTPESYNIYDIKDICSHGNEKNIIFLKVGIDLKKHFPINILVRFTQIGEK